MRPALLKTTGLCVRPHVLLLASPEQDATPRSLSGPAGYRRPSTKVNEQIGAQWKALTVEEKQVRQHDLPSNCCLIAPRAQGACTAHLPWPRPSLRGTGRAGPANGRHVVRCAEVRRHGRAGQAPLPCGAEKVRPSASPSLHVPCCFATRTLSHAVCACDISCPASTLHRCC